MDHLINEVLFDSNKQNETFFGDWNNQSDDVDFCFKLYDQLLNEESKETEMVSEWESCESEEDEIEESEIVDEVVDDGTRMAQFCVNLNKQLPKFDNLEELDPELKKEIEATKNDNINIDLLMCSSTSTNNLINKEASIKSLIKSKYGKWTCNGKFEPELGLGPLQELFIDNNEMKLSELSRPRGSVAPAMAPTISTRYQVFESQQPMASEYYDYQEPAYQSWDFVKHDHYSSEIQQHKTFYFNDASDNHLTHQISDHCWHFYENSGPFVQNSALYY